MPTRTRPTLDATPLYVLAGAGDAAVAKLRELPGTLQRLPRDLQRLPRDLQSRAGELGDRTNGTYTELAQRGRQVVGQIRRQPSTRRAVAQARSAVAKTRAARTSTERAAQAGAEAAGDATAKIG